MSRTRRLTAAQRRDEVLEAAMTEFAERGYAGSSTEDIARAAGISQPYLFRLFGTKKELYVASVNRCFRETLELFQRAAEGRRGEDALHEIGHAYVGQLATDRRRLQAQLQAYAACEDDEIRAAVRDGFGDLVAYARRVSGLGWDEVAGFFATGMLLNVLASMHAYESPEPWMTALLEASKDRR